ncbi:DNA polymerase III subunit alpha [Bacillus atrophaeus]|uniref:DNA polymerase III subunit alpha n=1 Tax=Bacillus atrophaeus TaxID=1452 RepID=UPI002E223F52|nr:DNA polymerase III subunit alpha [Bacillus atrophaeus]
MLDYVPLHAHTSEGSIGDSILKISEYVKQGKEYGLNALSVTDHGSLSAMYSFYNVCRSNGIKPIIGCEVYETKDRLNKDKTDDSSKKRWHLVLLARNNEGMENLLKIVNDAQMNGFYYKPRTDVKFLKEHGKGIICLSACVGGRISQSILNDDPDEALQAISDYKEAFDDFYLEIQPGTFDEQLVVNQALVELAEYTDTPLVVTNDVHYLRDDDCTPHDAHVKIARKKKFSDDMVYTDTIYWFMNRETVIEAFGETIDRDILEKAVDNTVKIAEMCNIELNQEVHMPKFDTENGESEELALARKCFEALENIKHTLADPAQYVTRLLYELDTINQLGFAGYFLMVEDFINYARSKGIAVGPGRGSVGGALVAYLLNISLADPIKYNLMFERFLSIHRKSIPDIDIDFDSSRRAEMFDYAVRKYGVNNCALVSTFQMRKARAAIRDTARILDLDLEIADKAAKLIPKVYYGDDGEKETDLSIEESLMVSTELRQMAEEYPELFEMAAKLSDIPSATSIHAAGILVTPVDLSKHIPLVRSNKEGVNATALNLDDAEMAGMVKFDFLSLASLYVYEKTQNDVGYHFDVLTSNFDDEQVWSLIGSKYTTGLFQISSKTYKSRMPRLKPKSIPELAHCLALLRGPCISSGADRTYMEILEGKQAIDPIHPLYYKATQDTLGILLYQEQLMEIAVNFGFTLEEGYRLVKVVAKKKIDKIKEFEDEFVRKAKEKGVEDDVVEKIWKVIIDAGQYCFNRAHAVTYAILSYISGYLKTYYPKEFLVNLLTNAYNRKKKEEITEALEDCRRLGFRFLPVDANASQWEFVIEDNKLRIGFCAVKGFGQKAAEEVIEKRPFSSFHDFIERIEKGKCSKRSMIPGIFSGMFSSFEEDRAVVYQEFMKERNEEPLEAITLQTKEKFSPTDDIEKLETILLGGQYVSDPSNAMESCGFQELKTNKIFKTEGYIKNIKRIKDRNNKPMAFLTLATGDGYIDCTVFSNVLSKNKKAIKKNRLCMIKAKKDGDYSCVAQEVS